MRAWLWLLLCISAGVFCQWDQGQIVAENVAGGSDMHYDVSKQVAHMIWCDVSQSKLYYRQVFANGTTTPPLLLAQTGKCGPSYIVGSDDSSKLYVLTTGGKIKADPSPPLISDADDERKENNNKNTMTAGDMAQDVYFVESSNGGLMWTAPMLIPRDPVNDYYERVAAAILFVHSTGRLWVFHRRQQYGTNVHSIAAASRSSGSTLFQREIVILTVSSPRALELPAVAYSVSSNEVIIHMAYIERLKSPYGFIKYLRSTNSGLTWGDPLIIEEVVDEANPLPNLSLATDPTVLNTPLYLSYSPYPLSTSFLRLSNDDGRTWLSPVALSNSSGASRIETKTCLKSKGKLVGLLVQTKVGLEFGLFNYATLTRQPRETPLNSPAVARSVKLACAVTETSLVAQAFITTETSVVLFVQYRAPLLKRPPPSS